MYVRLVLGCGQAGPYSCTYLRGAHAYGMSSPWLYVNGTRCVESCTHMAKTQTSLSSIRVKAHAYARAWRMHMHAHGEDADVAVLDPLEGEQALGLVGEIIRVLSAVTSLHRRDGRVLVRLRRDDTHDKVLELDSKLEHCLGAARGRRGPGGLGEKAI